MIPTRHGKDGQYEVTVPLITDRPAATRPIPSERTPASMPSARRATTPAGESPTLTSPIARAISHARPPAPAHHHPAPPPPPANRSTPQPRRSPPPPVT